MCPVLERAPTTTCVCLVLVAAVWTACDSQSAGSSCDEGFRFIDGECVRSGRGDAGATDAASDAPDTGAAPDSDADEIDDGAQTTCRELATRCADESTPQVCADGQWVDQAPCADTEACQNGRCIPRQACTPGEVEGCASDTAQRVCNDAGDLYVDRDCAEGLFCFRGSCGTQICEPGDMRCGTTPLDLERCSDDGTSWLAAGQCSSDANQVCFEGQCVSGCLASLKDPSYVGCEYWSVDLPQFQDPTTSQDPRSIPHAVVLANTSEQTADVTVETHSAVTVNPSTLSIPPGGIQTVTFPRNDVEGTELTDRSFRITTTQPIVAYQFNPLNDVGVYSNDASLLLPASAIGNEYYVFSWPGGVAIPGIGAQTGWFTVVASSPGVTQVTITFSADVNAGSSPPLQGITAGTTRTFPITQWSVLNFECESRFSIPPRLNDLTGTHIVADQPIVVFGGHEEAVIGDQGADTGDTVCCADHLEEQMLPVRVWGTHYLAAHSPPRGTEDDVWRVIAAQPGTTISTVPAISGLDGTTLGAGQWVEVSTNQSFEINASAPIQVAQYLVSQTAQGVEHTEGDPSMIVSVPVEQYRDDYVLLTPSGYADDYVTVIRLAGASVELDNTPLPDSDFTAFGTGAYELAHIAWNPGPHRLGGASPFGVVMAGYDSAVSYGYPGGLNLKPPRE